MKRPMLQAIVAVALYVSIVAAAPPTSTFNAVLTGRNLQSAAGTAGLATFTVDDRAIRYSVEIAGLKEVTNIILMVQNRALNLYAGPATPHADFEASGVLTESDLGGMTIAQLLREMESGKAQVTVFTVKLFDGSVGGRVERVGSVPETEPKAPDVKVAVRTT